MMALHYTDSEGQLQWRTEKTPPVGTMTLGEAVAELRRPDWACACVGGEWCCRRRWIQAADTHRAAHIIARQLSDLIQKRGEHERRAGR